MSHGDACAELFCKMGICSIQEYIARARQLQVYMHKYKGYQ